MFVFVGFAALVLSAAICFTLLADLKIILSVSCKENASFVLLGAIHFSSSSLTLLLLFCTLLHVYWRRVSGFLGSVWRSRPSL
jgi:hypothetical protein